MPNRPQVHIDRALTNLSVAYMQDASNFIADKVFPMVPVQKQSDLYFIYNRGDFLRDEAQLRANGAESAGGDYDIEQSPPYFCRVYAFHKDVNEQDRVNSDEPLKPDEDAMEFVSQKLMLRREVMWAENFFKPGIWAKDIAGHATPTTDNQTLFFDNPASDPVKVIKNEATKMQESTTMKPNVIVMSPYVKNALLEHPDVLDRIKYTQKGIATEALLAELFEVDRVLISQAVINKAGKRQDEDNEFIMGKHLLLTYAAKSPGIKKPSAGYIFTWKGYLGAGAFGNRFVRIPMPWLGLETERIEGEMAFDIKQVAADLGVLFTNIVNE